VGAYGKVSLRRYLYTSFVHHDTRRRAAIKALPLQIQQELTERARASRTKYREQWVI
jgi:hypothetical protein